MFAQKALKMPRCYARSWSEISCPQPLVEPDALPRGVHLRLNEIAPNPLRKPCGMLPSLLFSLGIADRVVPPPGTVLRSCERRHAAPEVHRRL